MLILKYLYKDFNMQLAVRIQQFAARAPGEVSELSEVVQAEGSAGGRKKRMCKCPGVGNTERYTEEIRHKNRSLN